HEASGRLRAAGVRTGVVSNQSGVALGLIAEDQVAAVNSELDRLIGPLGGWWYCPHGEQGGCGCRKPEPGLVRTAARALGCAPSHCVVIGDTAGDMGAARAAGARAVLVPNARTRPEEVGRAPVVARDLHEAVDRVFDLAVGR